jgi:hypothetical protein
VFWIWWLDLSTPYTKYSELQAIRAATHQLRQDMRKKRQKLTLATWLRPVCGGFQDFVNFNCAPFFAPCRRHCVLIVACRYAAFLTALSLVYTLYISSLHTHISRQSSIHVFWQRIYKSLSFRITQEIFFAPSIPFLAIILLLHIPKTRLNSIPLLPNSYRGKLASRNSTFDSERLQVNPSL